MRHRFLEPALLLGCLAVFLGRPTAQAQPPPRATLACAVEASKRVLRAASFCDALGRALGRPVTATDDARSVKRGDSVQVLRSDVQWIVIWLVDGRVRAWTRVSLIEPLAQQLSILVRAATALPRGLAEAPECVRLDPNAGYKVRSADLTYPWAELRPCKRKLVEVADPWWLPPRS
jgi:hypothetical protein